MIFFFFFSVWFPEAYLEFSLFLPFYPSSFSSLLFFPFPPSFFLLPYTTPIIVIFLLFSSPPLFASLLSFLSNSTESICDSSFSPTLFSCVVFLFLCGSYLASSWVLSSDVLDSTATSNHNASIASFPICERISTKGWFTLIYLVSFDFLPFFSFLNRHVWIYDGEEGTWRHCDTHLSLSTTTTPTLLSCRQKKEKTRFFNTVLRHCPSWAGLWLFLFVRHITCFCGKR